jgi:hypothetical protein
MLTVDIDIKINGIHYNMCIKFVLSFCRIIRYCQTNCMRYVIIVNINIRLKLKLQAQQDITKKEGPLFDLK